MYIKEILLYLIWPVIIIIAFYAVKWALKLSEKYISEEVKEQTDS